MTLWKLLFKLIGTEPISDLKWVFLFWSLHLFSDTNFSLNRIKKMRLILFVISAMALFLSELNSTVHAQQSEWSLALHGGAGVISKDLPDSMKQLYYEGLEEALSTGEEILSEGGSALEAVEMTVRSLEDNPLFNAGRGAVYTSEGTHELDAAIMDGSTLAAGAITGVTTIKNPISLARNVMTDSRHVLFSGAGAETFAEQTGVERVDNSYYNTKHRYEQWMRAQQQSNLKKEETIRGLCRTLNLFSSPFVVSPHCTQTDVILSAAKRSRNTSGISKPSIPDEYKYGTVGAVALDKDGNLAAATSTGGMTNKRFGRVGDVPIIGSGTFANHVAAISATGWGEQIMKNVSANTIANYMEFNDSTLEEAMDFVLTERLNPGDAGFIGVDFKGNISMQMNTVGMFRGSIDSHGKRTVMIWENE